jgi:hypothetical protein
MVTTVSIQPALAANDMYFSVSLSISPSLIFRRNMSCREIPSGGNGPMPASSSRKVRKTVPKVPEDVVLGSTANAVDILCGQPIQIVGPRSTGWSSCLASYQAMAPAYVEYRDIHKQLRAEKYGRFNSNKPCMLRFSYRSDPVRAPPNV